MSAWISNGLYVLGAVAVAFWGWKRHKKGDWFFAFVAFGLIAFESLARDLWGEEWDSAWSVVVVLLDMTRVVVSFGIMWLVWFCVGRAVLTLSASPSGRWPGQLDAARWFAPIVVVKALAFISIWLVPVGVAFCCLLPLLAWAWVRKTNRLDPDQLTG